MDPNKLSELKKRLTEKINSYSSFMGIIPTREIVDNINSGNVINFNIFVLDAIGGLSVRLTEEEHAEFVVAVFGYDAREDDV